MLHPVCEKSAAQQRALPDLLTYIVYRKVKGQAGEEHPLAVVLLLFGQNKHNDNMNSNPLGIKKSVRIWSSSSSTSSSVLYKPLF